MNPNPPVFRLLVFAVQPISSIINPPKAAAAAAVAKSIISEEGGAFVCMSAVVQTTNKHGDNDAALASSAFLRMKALP